MIINADRDATSCNMPNMLQSMVGHRKNKHQVISLHFGWTYPLPENDIKCFYMLLHYTFSNPSCDFKGIPSR